MDIKALGKKSWSLLKTYWYVPAIVGAIVVTAVISRKVPDSLMKTLKDMRERHMNEVRIIDETRKVEIAAKERAKKKMDTALAAVEEEFKKENEKLTRKKKREVKKIIKEADDDPKKLAELLASSTGFKVVLPEEDV